MNKKCEDILIMNACKALWFHVQAFGIDVYKVLSSRFGFEIDKLNDWHYLRTSTDINSSCRADAYFGLEMFRHD